MAINVGPGGQPEDVFEDILEVVLERLVATQMPEGSPTGDLGELPNFVILIIPRKLNLFLLWGLFSSEFAFNLELGCGI